MIIRGEKQTKNCVKMLTNLLLKLETEKNVIFFKTFYIQHNKNNLNNNKKQHERNYFRMFKESHTHTQTHIHRINGTRSTVTYR